MPAAKVKVNSTPIEINTPPALPPEIEAASSTSTYGIESNNNSVVDARSEGKG